ncbi:hypothetical protein FWH13_02965 [Candidatus Saccharibacteria bacterium]|nr:hypothetical protein [Candidatus Saccharibacteria bacterium]
MGKREIGEKTADGGGVFSGPSAPMAGGAFGGKSVEENPERGEPEEVEVAAEETVEAETRDDWWNEDSSEKEDYAEAVFKPTGDEGYVRPWEEEDEPEVAVSDEEQKGEERQVSWRKRGAMTLVVGVVVLAALVGAAFWWTRKQSPEGFMASALNNLVESDTVGAVGDFLIRHPDGDRNVRFDFEKRGNGNDFVVDVAFDVTGAEEWTLAGEGVFIGNAFFVKTELSRLLNISDEAEMYDDTWTRFSGSAASDLVDGVTGVQMNVPGAIQCVQEKLGDRRERNKLFRMVARSEALGIREAERRNRTLYLDIVPSSNPKHYEDLVRSVMEADLTRGLMDCLALGEVMEGDHVEAARIVRETLQAMPVMRVGIDMQNRQFVSVRIGIGEDGSTRRDLNMTLDVRNTQPVISAPGGFVEGDELVNKFLGATGEPENGGDEGGGTTDPEPVVPEPPTTGLNANDTRRRADMNSLLVAIRAYQNANDGRLPNFSEPFDAWNRTDPNGQPYTISSLNTWWSDGRFISIPRNMRWPDIELAGNYRGASVTLAGPMTNTVYVLYGAFCTGTGQATMYQNYEDTLWRLAILYRGQDALFCVDNR